MHPDIKAYNAALSASDRRICAVLAKAIDAHFAKQPGAESKVWHRHPVWFLDGNPIVGYHTLKGGTLSPPRACIRLLFWSGQSFDEAGLVPAPPGTKFKTAAAHYTDAADINLKDLKRWLKKSVEVQWDYKNLVKRKGKLLRLK